MQVLREVRNTGWPIRFVLQAYPDPALCAVIPKTEQCSGDTQPSSEEKVTRYASKLNRTLFAFLFDSDALRRDFEDIPSLARLLRDTATLSTSYGCTEVVKDKILVAARSWGGGEGKLVRQEPFLLLHTACTLEDQVLFNDALNRAAGQQAAELADPTELPGDLATIVKKHARAISNVVRKTHPTSVIRRDGSGNLRVSSTGHFPSASAQSSVFYFGCWRGSLRGVILSFQSTYRVRPPRIATRNKTTAVHRNRRLRYGSGQRSSAISQR